jgi:hypothetical protein
MDIKRKNELTAIIVDGERIIMSAFFKGHKHCVGDEFQELRDKVEVARCELFSNNPLYCKPEYRKKKGLN